MAKRKKEKIRTEFRKNRTGRCRESNLTRRYHANPLEDDEVAQKEAVSGKGALTRKRTVVGDRAEEDLTGLAVHPDVDLSVCKSGTVLSVHGLMSVVETPDGVQFQCTTRRLLKTLATNQRHVVVAGDRVWFRPQAAGDGIIQRIEPRHGILSRTSRGRQHVIVSNIDRLLIITSAAEPALKPHLIDRLIVSAEKGKVEPVICINKVDLIDASDLQPLVGVYGQMGYEILLVSACERTNIDHLRNCLVGFQSVVVGQSGVGKSSLLNAVAPDLQLQIGAVSRDTRKGRHTTTNARLIRWPQGGYVVDTPGVRQFELWDLASNEVVNFFRDVRPLIHGCRYPDCTHTHETDCAVKDAVADGRLDARRYESYCQLFTGD